MNAPRRAILTTSAALLLTALFAGCSIASGDVASLIPSAGGAPVSATPASPGPPTATPTATPTAIPGDADGNGSLSEFEKQQLARDAVRDYTMPDGSVVKVDPTKPLPPEVVAVIQEMAKPIVALNKDASSVGPLILSMRALCDQQTEATGRPIVIFHHAWSAVPGVPDVPSESWWSSVFPGGSVPVNAGPDREAVLAKVTAAAASRDAELIVVDYPG